MIDLAKLLVRAGDGGHGRVSFRREKYVPRGGPSGGKGGDGGSVIIRAVSHKNTLGDLVGIKKIEVRAGQAGGKDKMIGSRGESTVIEVPPGTIVWQLASNRTGQRRLLPDGSLREPLHRSEVRFEQYQLETETEPVEPPGPDSLAIEAENDQELARLLNLSLKNLDLKTLDKVCLAELLDEGDELLVAQGGFGGRGNDHFKSSRLTTPMIAEYGTRAEERLIILELRLLADIGLVGLPNAGKSTFLSHVTKARPKIANYPFTTLEPQLGVWEIVPGKELVLADIPGLIEGASRGQGLGHDFLRHIEACKQLLFLVSPDETELAAIHQGELLVEELAESLREQYQLLSTELAEHDPLLLEKPRQLALNKIDLLPQEFLQELREKLQAMPEKKSGSKPGGAKTACHFISAASGEGLADLRKALVSGLSS